MLNTATHTTFSIDPRYSGLPGLALGGYSSGLLAARLDAPAVAVKLRRPVPTSRPLALAADADRAELRDGDTLLAEGAAADLDLEIPTPPSLGEAASASERFPGLHAHPYPECFACGPHRHDGDGLRLFPGAVDGRPLVAAVWTPRDEVGGGAPLGQELIWSAFDCAQLWALMIHGPGGRGERAVTAMLAGSFELPVIPGRPHVLIAWSLDRQESSLRAGAALFGPEGELCAVGVQTAVTAKWGVPLDFVSAAAPRR